ncbi:MAG: leucine-rich repeat domain-containing protein, partial [Muribaculaceae bacterium]|nr:leucine-rich repeat domain-containing protein [Muribaculaceae bacterium]
MPLLVLEHSPICSFAHGPNSLDQNSKIAIVNFSNLLKKLTPMQRNIVSFIFLLISVVLPLQSMALQYNFEYTYEGQTVKYLINNDGTTCKTVDCYSERGHDINGKLILPSHPKDKGGREYILTAIGYGSFYDNDRLTSVEIPNTVTTIGHYAFENCDQLSQVKLPDTLKSIGSASFHSCISLTSIYIPETVENIYHSAFRSCTNLSTINLPDKLTKIWFGTFEECRSLTSIVIPNSVEEIEYNAFQDCSGLQTIIIGASVSSVGKDAFKGCHPVKFAYPKTLSENPFGDFGSNLATLGAYNPNGAIIEDGWIYGPDKKEIRFAPYDLEGDYVIPDTIISIGTSAFYNCKRITSITIPNSLQIIDDFAFYNCIGIDSCSLVIPRSVSVIGKRAFYNCSFINIIVGRTPSDGAYIINKQSFSGCQYKKYAYSYGFENPFTAIPDDPEFGSYNSDGAIIENGWIFGPDKKEIRYAPYELEGEYVIPETVTSIGEYAFSRCRELTKVIGTDSITHVGKYAFYASGITSIELPSVRYIGMGAFNDCRVKSVSLGWGITDILYNTFAYSDLTYLDIPNSVKEIGENAFYYCKNLKSLLIPNSVTSIGKLALAESGIESLIIPNSINQIGIQGLRSCKNLSDIVIGNGI